MKAKLNLAKSEAKADSSATPCYRVLSLLNSNGETEKKVEFLFSDKRGNYRPDVFVLAANRLLKEHQVLSGFDPCDELKFELISSASSGDNLETNSNSKSLPEDLDLIKSSS